MKSVNICNPYVIYCKSGHLYNRLQLFFNYFFFCLGRTIPLASHIRISENKKQKTVVHFYFILFFFVTNENGSSRIKLSIEIELLKIN